MWGRGGMGTREAAVPAATKQNSLSSANASLPSDAAARHQSDGGSAGEGEVGRRGGRWGWSARRWWGWSPRYCTRQEQGEVGGLVVERGKVFQFDPSSKAKFKQSVECRNFSGGWQTAWRSWWTSTTERFQGSNTKRFAYVYTQRDRRGQHPSRGGDRPHTPPRPPAAPLTPLPADDKPPSKLTLPPTGT